MTEFLKFELIVQFILVVVIIIQTTYIGNSLRLNRRMNQYQLLNEWNQKLRDVYEDKTIPHISDPQVYNDEYQNLIFVFQDMHGLFKDKLLKSSDFMIMFMRLQRLTDIEAENNSAVFKQYHMILQTIYDDFNNIDCAMKLFDYFDNGIADEIMKEANKDSLLKIGMNDLIKNFSKRQKWLRLGLWFSIKIKKNSFFVLPNI